MLSLQASAEISQLISTIAVSFLYSTDILQMKKDFQRLFPTYGGRKQGSLVCTKTFTLQVKLSNPRNHKAPWKALSLWAEEWPPKMCTACCPGAEEMLHS